MQLFVGGTVGANYSIREFTQHYKDNPDVTIEYFNNINLGKDDKGNWRGWQVNNITLEQVPQLSRADLEAEALSIVDKLKKEGKEIAEYKNCLSWCLFLFKVEIHKIEELFNQMYVLKNQSGWIYVYKT